MEENILITPKTRVGELLTAFPDLEETLISFSPAFEKLRNPVLRRTIARVATLQQVAVVGNVPLEKLINALRAGSGQQDSFNNNNEQIMNNEKPAWIAQHPIHDTLDAREMLQRGEHPLNLVLAKAHEMSSGSVFELITTFIPQPLIEKVKALGLESYSEIISPQEVKTYFFKP